MTTKFRYKGGKNETPLFETTLLCLKKFENIPEQEVWDWKKKLQLLIEGY